MKRNVLFVVHQMNFGGVQKTLLTALNAIDYEKNDVTLYIRKARTELLGEVNSGVGKIIVNDDNRHYYRMPRAVLMTLRHRVYRLFGRKKQAEAIKQKLGEYIADQKILYEKKRYFSEPERYDVAVSYIQGYPAKLVANCVAADRKVMFFHGSTDESHLLHTTIFDRIDRIVGVNAGVRDELKRLYPAWKDKITCLTNYVNADEVREKSRAEKIETPAGRTVLCSCGRLTPVKGMNLAVQAAKKLRDTGERFVWYLIGDGPERSTLENMIREYGLADAVIITGMQANPYPLLDACDIYVQPSYEEAHGAAMVEAQILCKPVVTTATLGGKTLIQNGINGMVAAIDADALAEAIAGLMHAPETMAKMRAYLKKAEEAAEQSRYQNEWEDLLEGKL